MSSSRDPALPMALGDSGAEIRPFEPGDLPRLQAIREAAFAPVFRSFRALVGKGIAEAAFAQAEDEQRKLLADIAVDGSGHHLFVVLLGPEIVGFIAFTADDAKKLGEIGLNAVLPHHAGKGIGTAMYRFALGRLRQLGMVAAEVGTGGDSSHAAARRAYEKAGFGSTIVSVHMYRRL